MTVKVVGVFETEALRFPLLEPPERRMDLDIFDVVSGDEHQGNMCGSVTCLYNGAGPVGFVKVILNFEFFLLIRNYVSREESTKKEKNR